jgi:hypothetical protein
MQKEVNIQVREQILKETVIQLKKEFIGIDGIIDEIADVILPWWLFPQHQVRPLIVNLWGMTGSGKTALVTRMCELLQYKSFLMRFDMGEFGNNSSFLKYTLTKTLWQFHETSPVILLDEFQFAKTIDEQGKEVNNNTLRVIWDLLDSGLISYEPDGGGYYFLRVKKAIQILKGLKKTGLTLKKGTITSNPADAHQMFSNTYILGYQDGSVVREEGKLPFKESEIFLSDVFCTGIYELIPDSFTTWKEVAENIKKLNSLDELIQMLELLMEETMSFKTTDLSKSLIFVVGNIDEAFSMSGSINPDIDADEYRRFTLKITIADIKRALQSRFRHEQIARLGNNHLIYHAFSHKNFEELIQLHLGKVAKLIQEKFKLRASFSKEVADIIYAEGVFPTQGVRPVVSTVRNLIESNIAKIVLHYFSKKLKATSIRWNYLKEQFVIEFIENKKVVSTLKLPFLQKVNSLRKSIKNDLQAMVAVHESGHVVAALMMIGVLPEYVITRTVDSESQGFAYILLPEEIETKRLLIDKIKISLGGYAAEQIIFGKDNNTTGVHADLRTVTGHAHSIVREFGMTDEPYKMNIHTYGGSPYQFTFTDAHEEAARKIVLDAAEEVKACIVQHKKLVLKIADYLSDNSRMEKEDILAFAKEYAAKEKIELPTLVNKETYYNFRTLLKKMK